MMEYKGYIGHVVFDDDADIFHGEVVNTRDVITFQGESVQEIKKEFIESIDDYLDFCKVREEHPEKPFSGKFTLRMPPSLHSKIYSIAKIEAQSINAWVTKTLKQAIEVYPNEAKKKSLDSAL